jgi:hypothetical protein
MRPTRIIAADGHPASPAVAAALATVRRAFSNPNGRVRERARDAIRAGAHANQNRARYGDLARRMRDQRLDLDDAVAALDHAYAVEKFAHERSAARWGGTSCRPRTDLLIVAEARLVCRFLRRHAPSSLADILPALTTPCGHPVMLQAAE